MRRVLRTSPATLIAVLFATALVVFTAMIQAGVRSDLERAARTATGNADVIVTAPSGADLPSSLSDQIRALPGVAEVTEQVAGTAIIDDELGAAIGVQSLNDDTLIRLTAGRMPSDDNEAVLVEVPGKPTRYLTGAEITVEGYSGGTETITIVGTATAKPGATAEPALSTLVCSPRAAQRLLGLEGSTALLAHASGNVNQAHGEVAAAVDESGHESGRVATVENSEAFVAANASKYAAGTRTIMLALQLLTAVALLAALVVIGNNYRLQLARSTREIALLRSIGALRRQVFSAVLARAASVGVLGALGGFVLGTVVGAVVGAAVLQGLPAAASQLGFWVRLIVLALAAGVIPSVLAALWPAKLATRVAPIEALRRAEPASEVGGAGGAGGVERGRRRVPRRVRLAAAFALLVAGVGVTVAGGFAASIVLVVLGALAACAGLMLAAAPIFTCAALGLGLIAGTRVGSQADLAREQLRRNPGRSGATAVAVWIGTTLMAALLTGSATAQATLGQVFEGATPMDITVTPSGEAEVPAGDPAELSAQISQLTEVAASAVVADVMLDASFSASPDGGGPMTVAAWNPQLSSVLRTDAVIPGPAPGTIILPPTPETTGGSGPGTVTLRQPGTEHDFAVTVVDGAPIMGIVHPSDLERFNEASLSVWVKLVPDADPLEAMDAIAQLPGVAALSSPAVQRLEANAEIAQFVALGLAFLAVALLIAVVGLSNTVALSVTERTREIGLLRALGALRSQITGMILAETLLLASAASLIGMAFGVLFGIAGAHALLGGEQLYVFAAVPWLSLAALLVVLLAAAALAALLPARRAAAIPPVAALVH
ncbi:ABC transporter permease YtrF precursor [Corynebacterium glaucum]|uniref:FtsX-like permease family protein n=1 Tax=Corynebacterium glaucum TaxID=187491 RepID=UPI0025B4E593|nr:FtsX family ABC transporter permease [Corynebacterium glaucum]WJZ08214.1 ABC transporter permease YtrF precursor [Corynebacterium glaucum]